MRSNKKSDAVGNQVPTASPIFIKFCLSNFSLFSLWRKSILPPSKAQPHGFACVVVILFNEPIFIT